MNYQHSETGFLVICKTCTEHTAKHFDGASYFCDSCFDGEQTVRAPMTEELIKKCDCGATKVGGLHSHWCSANSDDDC